MNLDGICLAPHPASYETGRSHAQKFQLGLLFAALALPAFGQGNISTVAGNATQGYFPSQNGGPATSASLYLPQSVAFDASGNYYIADPYKFVVRKVTAAGTISTVAGSGTQGNTIKIGTTVATKAALGLPAGVAVDKNGNLYIADQQLDMNCVWKVTPAGVISIVAGDGGEGFAGDGGAATSAELDQPGGVAVDSSGNLYIADTANQRIRKVNTAGTISTVAGIGYGGYSGDGGQATSAEINSPYAVAVDSAGNLYIADTENAAIRKVNTSGIISTLAGSNLGCSGNYTQASGSALDLPTGVAVDAGGNVYIADQYNNRASKVNLAGIMSTVAGYGCDGTDGGYNGDGIPATSAELYFPGGVAADSIGNVYIADTQNFRVRKTAALVPILTSEMDTADSKNAVYYLGYDSNLYALANHGSWTYTQATGTNGKSSVAGSTGIATYVNTIYNGNEAFYTANSAGALHVEQLWGSTGAPTDLTAAASGKPVIPESNLVGYIDSIAGTDNVFYLGTDHFVHVLTWSPSGGWQEEASLDNTTEPAAATGSSLSGHMTASSEEVFYFGANQHVYELWRWSKNFDGWHSTDVTAASCSTTAAAGGSPLAGFYDSVADDDVAFYLGTDQHIYELLFTSAGDWSSIDVTATAKAPNAASGTALTAHRDSLTGANSEEVFFLDANQHVQELWASSSSPIVWHSSDLTATTGAALAAQGSALTTDISTLDNTDHVFYIGSSDKDVHELWWNGTWYTDTVNTQTSPVAPMAVP